MSEPTATPPAATPRVAAVLLAAGSGTRVGAAGNKVLLPLGEQPVLGWSLRTVRGLAYVDQVVVVFRAADRSAVQRIAGSDVLLVEGGPSRHASEWNALTSLAERIDAGRLDMVAIHDTARPLASAELWDRVVEAAVEHGGAIPVRHQPGLLTREGNIPGDGDLVAVQTPQAFQARPLLDAYRQAHAEGFEGTDTAACVGKYADLEVHGVEAPATNLKITFPEDVAVAERLLPAKPSAARLTTRHRATDHSAPRD
jgi:2-C-methyl-D-erythritol 4-phosphate cytidylyltransferase